MKTVISLAAVLLLTLSRAPAQEPPPLAPKIVCDQTVYDFGQRDNSEVVEHHYVIRNEGSLSLEIRGVRATCGCTAVKPEQNVIPPGGETKIQVRLNLSGRSGMQIKTVTVQSNDPETPNLTLQIRGTATQPLRIQPATLFFGRLDPNAARTRNIEVISERGPVEIADIRTEHPGIRVERLEPEPDADGSRHLLAVTLDESLPGGAVNSQIIVQIRQGDTLKSLSVPVAAMIVESSAP
ncbi:MAG: DUF1573 domain-containing protein [Lentisphaerae bacterium]|nr:DUF1573 domain-containing protein [Lentisphaerota bacterium]